MFYPLGSISSSTKEDARSLAEWWWVVALRGVAAILFGAVALALPNETFSILVIALAAACLVDGAINLYLTFQCMRTGGRCGFVALHSFIGLGLGLTVFWPHIAATTFVLLVGLWSIFSGVVMLNLSVFMSGTIRPWPLYLAGSAGFFFGVFLVLEPGSGRILLTWGVGVSAIFGGIALIASAIMEKRSLFADEW